MDSRDKRDLPEVVAEILIEQHAMRQEISALRQEMRADNAALRQELQNSHEGLVQLFNGLTGRTHINLVRCWAGPLRDGLA